MQLYYHSQAWLKDRIGAYGPDRVLLGAAITFITLAFLGLWSGMFIENEQGYVTQSVNIWGDWVVHLSYTNAYLDWPLAKSFSESPLLHGEPFQYPPLPNLLSAMLVALKIPITFAMVITSFIANVLTAVALILLYRRLSIPTTLAIVGAVLFFFNGGLGWLHLLNGEEGKLATHLSNKGIIIQNFVISEFIPQKAISTAAPFFLFYIFVLHGALANVSQALSSFRRVALTIALLTFLSAMVLLSSMHTFLCLIIVSASYALFHLKCLKWLIALGVVGAVINGAIYFAYYGQNDTSGFIKWAPLELANNSGLNPLAYFFWNYGLFVPLAIIGMLVTRAYRNPLAVSGVLIFVVAHLVQFQPWIWDNSKLVTWAYCFLIVPILFLFERLSQKGYKQSLRDVMVASLVFAGAYDIWQVAKPSAQSYVLFTQKDIELARAFREQTTPESLTLIYSGHNNWVHALAGRQVLNAFSGWMWSYGKDTGALETRRDRLIREGEPALREEGVDYVVIDRRHQPKKSLSALQTLPTLIEDRRYLIKEVREN